MVTKVIAFAGITGVCFTSCWNGCLSTSSGIVKDVQAGAPLDSVLVKVYYGGDYVEEFLTDSVGAFFAQEAGPKFILAKECKEIRLDFSREGYKPTTVSARGSRRDATVLMTR